MKFITFLIIYLTIGLAIVLLPKILPLANKSAEVIGADLNWIMQRSIK